MINAWTKFKQFYSWWSAPQIAKQSMEESENKFKGICTSALDAIITMDQEGRISCWNQAAERIFGYTEEEALGKEMHMFIAPERYTEQFRKGFSEIKETGEDSIIGKTLEIEALRKDGTEFPVVLSISAVITGNQWSAIGVLRDITHRKKAEEKIRRQMNHLSALRDIDLTINASLDIRVTLGIFIEHVSNQLNVDAADVLLLNPYTQILEYKMGRGFRTEVLKQTRLHLGEGHAGKAASDRQIIHISDLRAEKEAFSQAPMFKEEGFLTYYAAPLIAKGRIKGVLEIFQRTRFEPDLEWVDFLETLATQAAIAIDHAEMFDALERSHAELLLAYDTTIEGWSRALDLRDKETEGHSQRVTVMTIRIARAMGMNEQELVNVRRGALLHDIGKIGVPDHILLKPDKLSDEEWKVMKSHPMVAYDLLSPISFLHPALDIPCCHHEKWDGTGYPRGLKGEQIPCSARIFAVVDVWDALRSDRPYRPPWPAEKVREHIHSEAGTHFDPKVVELFLQMNDHELVAHTG